uniref:Uncharacterized protein n=1 Tax=Romanomermis culicivorax TaxID=13658 RepID=A0A915JTI2_ROMCU
MTRPPWKAYQATVWACACLFMKLSRLGRIPQSFTGFHYQAHAYVTMKLRGEFNARQEGLGNNFHAMYASCQSRAVGLAYTIAKAVLEDKKDPEPNYANIQVWKKETDNTDPCIRFWEFIDRKKAHDILEVEKNLKKKVGYRVKHAYNRSAASKVPRRWVKKYRDVRRREKSETPNKDRKRKHGSRQRDEKRCKKSMSKEKRRKENDEESECRRQKEWERREKSRERKQEGEKGTKEHKDSRKSRSRKRMLSYFQHDNRLDVSYSSQAASLDRARNNKMAQQGVPMCDTNAMLQAQQQQVSDLPPNYPGLPMVGFDCLNPPLFPGQLLASAAVPLPTPFQMPQFPMMQQGPYYHQFLVLPGVQMPPQTKIRPMRSVQGEERMDIPGPSMVMQPPQRSPSAANPDYISPLKWDTEIGQPGWDHSGQRHK